MRGEASELVEAQMMYNYGDLVTSEAHIPQAQGPYMVVHTLKDWLVCVSLDNVSTINIPRDKVKSFPLSTEIAKKLLIARE